MSAAALAELLRRPGEVARRCRDDEGLRELTGTSLAATVAGAAAFGAVLGGSRGELQALFSGVKLPLAVLGALVVCVPAFHALAAALGRPWTMRRMVALVVAAQGRAALVLLALAPILWLAIDFGAAYHATIVCAITAYGIAGLAALSVLLRGLAEPGERGGRDRWVIAGAFVVLFAAVSGQTAWSLRPYLGRPTHADVPFVRDVEGSFADAVVTNARSAAGFYDTRGGRP